jgi:hypothetical protein
VAEDESGGPPDERHPIAAGLLALLAVGLTVGLIMGGVALAATKVIGVGEDSASDDATSEGSLYLPRPSKTEGHAGPLITLAPTDQDKTEPTETEPTESESKKKEKEKTEIALSAGQTSVGVMERIDLTGVYPGGEGAILQVQRFNAGSWEDFPVTASVSNGTFTTYIQASSLGKNRIRVVDTNTGEKSNEVRVRIG